MAMVQKTRFHTGTYKSCVEITSGNQEQQGNLGATAENCFPTRNRIVHAKLMKMDAESEGYIAREVID